MKRILFGMLLLLGFTLPSYAQTQGTWVITSVTTVGPSTGAVNEIGTGVNQHKITWNVTGTVSACSITVQQSANGTTGWSTLISAQTCTSNGGPTTYVSGVANYVRVIATSFTGSGSVTVHYTAYQDLVGNTTGTGTANQLAYFTGTSTLGSSSNFTVDPTTGAITILGAASFANGAFVISTNAATLSVALTGTTGTFSTTVVTPLLNTATNIPLQIEAASILSISISTNGISNFPFGLISSAGATINGGGLDGNTSNGISFGSLVTTQFGIWATRTGTRTTTNNNLSFEGSTVTGINAPNGGTIELRVSGNGIAHVSSTGIFPQTDNTQFLGTLAGGRWAGVSATGVLVTSFADSNGVVTENYSAPTSCVGSGCTLVTGSKNTVGKLTTTTTGAASIVITFSQTATNGRTCSGENETTFGAAGANQLKFVSTTTTTTITGTTVNGDIISYRCGTY